MKTFWIATFTICVCLSVTRAEQSAQPAAQKKTGKPLGLHPENPHYFLFRGKPAVLITSTEHYGAVLNPDFDYVNYLDDNLDPSFATDDPTGSGKVQQADGRYDCRDVRAQLGVLKRFMESLDFIHMRPNQLLLRPWPHSPSEDFYALENPGKAYAVYFKGSAQRRRTKFAMDLPAGQWQPDWVAPRDGSLQKLEPFTHPGGGWLTETPEFAEDIALRLKQQ